MTTNHNTALVTGATRGIGREVVRQLLDDGYRVIATGRSRDDLDSLKAETASSHLIIATVDLESTDLEAQVLSAIGDSHLDLLVANAARFAAWDEVASSADLTNAAVVMQVNLFGTWRVIQAASPRFATWRTLSDHRGRQRLRLARQSPVRARDQSRCCQLRRVKSSVACAHAQARRGAQRLVCSGVDSRPWFDRDFSRHGRLRRAPRRRRRSERARAADQ